VNTSRDPLRRLVLRSRVLSPDNRLLGERVDRLEARADATTTLPPFTELARSLMSEPLVLVKLTLTGAHGELLSENVYWQSRTPADQQALNRLAPQPLRVTARADSADGAKIGILVGNDGGAAALNAKITVLDEAGARVLPAYYSDNYLTLLPGESRRIDVRCPAPSRCARVALRGWNVVPLETLISR